MSASEAAKLIQAGLQARRDGRLADGQRDLLAAVSICRGQGDGGDLIRALKALGQIERDLGRIDAARARYEEAVTLCRTSGDASQLAHTLRHLGDVHQDAQRADLAEPCYREALVLYHSCTASPPLDVANAIRSLALLQEGAGPREESQRLWADARSLYASICVQAGVDECNAHLERLE